MRAEIKALHQRLKNTVIYVTHDQIEAITMGDRIVVMNAGKIEQIGRPLAIYDRPANLFVASFIGSPSMNFIEGSVQLKQNQACLITAHGVEIELPDCELVLGQKITIGIRPEHIAIAPANPSVDLENPINLRLELIEPTGAETYLYGKIDQYACCIALRERLNLAPHDDIKVNLPKQHLHIFDTASTLRLN